MKLEAFTHDQSPAQPSSSAGMHRDQQIKPLPSNACRLVSQRQSGLATGQCGGNPRKLKHGLLRDHARLAMSVDSFYSAPCLAGRDSCAHGSRMSDDDKATGVKQYWHVTRRMPTACSVMSLCFDLARVKPVNTGPQGKGHLATAVMPESSRARTEYPDFCCSVAIPAHPARTKQAHCPGNLKISRAVSCARSSALSNRQGRETGARQQVFLTLLINVF